MHESIASHVPQVLFGGVEVSQTGIEEIHKLTTLLPISHIVSLGLLIGSLAFIWRSVIMLIEC